MKFLTLSGWECTFGLRGVFIGAAMKWPASGAAPRHVSIAF
jgi:hypothetical protein